MAEHADQSAFGDQRNRGERISGLEASALATGLQLGGVGVRGHQNFVVDQVVPDETVILEGSTVGLVMRKITLVSPVFISDRPLVVIDQDDEGAQSAGGGSQRIQGETDAVIQVFGSEGQKPV